jgi:hypothetical protein
MDERMTEVGSLRRGLRPLEERFALSWRLEAAKRQRAWDLGIEEFRNLYFELLI